MLNLRSHASNSSDELRSANATATEVTQRQLHVGVRPRSSAASRDGEPTPNISSSRASSSSRMPDRDARRRAMSAGDSFSLDALRRALTAEHDKLTTRAAVAATKPVQNAPRFPQPADDMETKRMMGWSIRRKDRDLGISSSASASRTREQQRRDQQNPSDPVEEQRAEQQKDDVIQELQLRTGMNMTGSYSMSMDMGFIPVDDHRALARCATSYEHDSPGYDGNSDDDDEYGEDEGGHGCYFVDTPELAAFLGLPMPGRQQPQQAQQQYQGYPPPMAPKAASFSGQHYSQQQHTQSSQQSPQYLRGMVPCSPPVPIPRKQLRRRRNSVTGSLLTMNGSPSRGFGGDLSESNYSRTQCEARLWDEDWNFKLSLEARESFEASNNNNNNNNNSSGSVNKSNSRGVWKPQSTSSMASTADTFHDEEGDQSTGSGGDNDSGGDEIDEDEDDQVFDMDDL